MTDTAACGRTLTTTDLDDRPIEVACQLPAGHEGTHHHGHTWDEVWAWDDDDEG